MSRAIGFGLLPAISFVGPILLIPVLSHRLGADGWGAIASGQALGAIGQTIVIYGWSVVGPAMIAGKSLDVAKATYFTAFIMRMSLLIFVAPACAVLAFVLVPREWSGLSATAAALSCLPGMSCSWLFVGLGRPKQILVLETLPRMFSTVVSAGLLTTGLDVRWYFVVWSASEFYILVNNTVRLSRKARPLREHAEEAFNSFRQQLGLTVSSVLALGYQRAAVPVVAAAYFPSAAVYAACDRAQAYARLPIGPFVQTFQHWVYVSVPDVREFARRARLASLVVIGASVVIGLIVVLFAPVIAPILFGQGIHLALVQVILVGFSILFVGVALSAVSFLLVPLGQVQVLSRIGVLASLVALPSIWIAARTESVTAPLIVVAVTEGMVALIELWLGLAALRRAGRAVLKGSAELGYLKESQ